MTRDFGDYILPLGAGLVGVYILAWLASIAGFGMVGLIGGLAVTAYGFLATVVDVGKPWRWLTGRVW